MVKNDVHGMKVSDKKVIACQYSHHISIYKLGSKKPIKIKFEHNGGTIDFTRNGSLVYSQPKENKILTYSINDNNALELESIYKIHSDDLRECGILGEDIWVRTSRYLYFWDSNTLKECSHSLCFLGTY